MAIVFRRYPAAFLPPAVRSVNVLGSTTTGLGLGAFNDTCVNKHLEYHPRLPRLSRLSRLDSSSTILNTIPSFKNSVRSLQY